MNEFYTEPRLFRLFCDVTGDFRFLKITKHFQNSDHYNL